MTQKWLLGSDHQSDRKWLKSDSKMRSGVTFESKIGHFGVGLPGSLLSHFWVTLGHFNSFWVSVDLGARWLHNPESTFGRSWLGGSLRARQQNQKASVHDYPKERFTRYLERETKVVQDLAMLHQQPSSTSRFSTSFSRALPPRVKQALTILGVRKLGVAGFDLRQPRKLKINMSPLLLQSWVGLQHAAHMYVCRRFHRLKVRNGPPILYPNF